MRRYPRGGALHPQGICHPKPKTTNAQWGGGGGGGREWAQLELTDALCSLLHLDQETKWNKKVSCLRK